MTHSTQDAVSERTALKQERDNSNTELLLSLQRRLDSLEEDVKRELANLSVRMMYQLEQSESRMAEITINRSVKQAFSHLGVDVDDPKDMQRFRDDLRFGGVFRHAFSKSFFAFIAAICGGIGLSLWLAFKDQFGWK